MANMNVNQLNWIVDWMIEKFDLNATKIQLVESEVRDFVTLFAHDEEKDVIYYVRCNPACKSFSVQITYHVDLSAINDEVFG